MPLDSIKIDRAFVAALDGDPRADAVIDGIVAIAARLGLRTVAEGIETAGQLAHVTRLGCDLAQGFHFARPLTAAELEPRLPGANGATGGPGFPAAVRQRGQPERRSVAQATDPPRIFLRSRRERHEIVVML